MAHQDSSPSIIVVMVPFPLQSHLNQLLQLSQVISSYYNIQVHYVASSHHISQVKSRATNRNPNSNTVFHALPDPEVAPSPSPNSADFAAIFVPSFEASIRLRRPVKRLIASLSEAARRLVVIHDPLMSIVVQDARGLRNAEFYIYNCIAAVATFAAAHRD